MQIKFLTTYQNKDGSERNLAAAQSFLLQDWYKAIHKNNIKFIEHAKVYFVTYSFEEYYDQDKLKNIILPYYEYSIQFVEYNDFTFDQYYKDMAKDYRLMELIISTEAYDND